MEVELPVEGDSRALNLRVFAPYVGGSAQEAALPSRFEGDIIGPGSPVYDLPGLCRRRRRGGVARRLLVIDDDVAFTAVLKIFLEQKDFEVAVANTGVDGLRLAYSWDPDLIILDVMMPELNGWQVSEQLNGASSAPIIMLTAVSSTEGAIRGFQVGVDDYLAKPFNTGELLARINAILRRREPRRGEAGNAEILILDAGRFVFDREQKQVRVNGRQVNLSPTEFKLLSCLIENADRFVPHDQLIKEVWRTKPAKPTSASLKQYISYLRHDIEEDPANPKYILTYWGVGYMFCTGKKQSNE